MSEILKPGIVPEFQRLEATCNRCGCLFRFRRGEAGCSSDPREGGVLTIKCPQEGCGNTVYKDANDHRR